jgi:6-pyruvoyltetrahydropterin/6-carboxytetrahydropterin synthase
LPGFSGKYRCSNARTNNPLLARSLSLQEAIRNYFGSAGNHLPFFDHLAMLTYLTRTVRFSAAHRYHRPEWSPERNREAFGACSNPHGHGHNYLLEVMVSGQPDLRTGFCTDLVALDRLLQEEVRDVLDHQHINHVVPEFGEGGQIPTTENLVVWIWARLAPRIEQARLVRLRLREDADLFVDYYGPARAEEDGTARWV